LVSPVTHGLTALLPNSTPDGWSLHQSSNPETV
jgi:hypothetical protein